MQEARSPDAPSALPERLHESQVASRQFSSWRRAKDAWERGAEKAGFRTNLRCVLANRALVCIKGSHKEHVVILLTREGKWIHVRVPVSDPEATSLRFEQHRSVEDLCEWVARLVETAGYEDYFSYSEPFAVELGRSPDKLLESSIEDKRGRANQGAEACAGKPRSPSM